MSLTLTRKFMSLKQSFLARSLSIFIIPAGWWSAGFNYLTKNHLKDSLSLVLWILIKPFLGWSNSFSNLIELLPAKGLYFEIRIVWWITESIIQPEPFPKNFSMCFIIVDRLEHLIYMIYIDNYLCFSAWIKILILAFIFTFYLSKH